MNKTERTSLIIFLFLIVVALLFAFAGSQGGSALGGIPVFGVLVGLAMLIQWLAFIPAFRLQTEKFFDLTGSITYISVCLLYTSPSPRD